ncbi:MAG: hypothetical protein L0G99_14240 [Propionibacteriales bacterium]|nr:hypothetical protein [Propionibacteriales bacterium]
MLSRPATMDRWLSCVDDRSCSPAWRPTSDSACEAWARGLEATLTALAPVESATVTVRTNVAETTKVWPSVVARPQADTAELPNTAVSVHATIAVQPVPDSPGQGTIFDTTPCRVLPSGTLELGLSPIARPMLPASTSVLPSSPTVPNSSGPANR